MHYSGTSPVAEDSSKFAAVEQALPSKFRQCRSLKPNHLGPEVVEMDKANSKTYSLAQTRTETQVVP